ncbi:hypothetical protein DN730_10980 [Marinomonas piezotolerans]|uniref:Uncharacterized protein n=1 Tax=Marinomonas piezotolerans TaxID=2213058 RepID=A0A370U8M8_9GAMM|nr:hypothetical protein [Marinomonas piezotolerans]RDL44149.1 hypothetical protein DN730_10980 [Marinomonas piezotolerans]
MVTEEIDRYSVVEIEDMLSNLAQDKASLARIYRYYEGLGCEPRTGLTPEDIMVEVWLDTLSEVRIWKRGIETLKHFKEVGRSVISNAADKQDQLEHIESEDQLYGENGVLSIATAKLSISHQGVSKQESSKRVVKHTATVKSSAPSPENLLVEHQKGMNLKEWTSKVLDLFRSDSDVMCYLKQFLNDNTIKPAIMDACSFSESVYNNVRKRIKDKVRKRLPNGINWWEISE